MCIRLSPPVAFRSSRTDTLVIKNLVNTKKKKKQRKPIPSTIIHDVQIQTDDSNIEAVQYVNSATQTEIRCSWDDKVVDKNDRVRLHSDDIASMESM